MTTAQPPAEFQTSASREAGPLQVLTDARHLAVRAIRESVRQPGVEITNVFIPLFFLAVSTGAIANFSERGFGVENYLAFQLPVAVLQAVAGSSAASGIAIVLDMERGYFDKLLLTPASRWSLIIGRVWADAVRAIFFASIMLIAALVAGSGMATGVPGAILILVIAGLFGGAYSGIGIFIAMRTGNAQAAQAGFLLFFPLLFMAPAFAPLAVFDDWLRWIATVNPVTYIMEGMRGLVMEGYAWPVTEGGQIVFGPDGLPLTKDPPALHWAFVSLAGFSAFTLTIAALALRARTRAD
ncbi:MAG: ABC transporter permease [Chloroflexota bacterium]|nr:ABC transporter permease [Chloroflexota bacterium]MDE2894016.1 ABC transporter permease [Chloroflexota bacterium]